MADGMAPIGRVGARVRGAVQGVGFRPFVHRLATELGLTGFVRNDGDGVWLEVEGPHVADFLVRLRRDAPPLARIEELLCEAQPAQQDAEFRVERSTSSAIGAARIPPDAGICDACTQELFTPGDRRFGYPFVACCDCGPRFTMTRQLPYDRGQTSMAAFPLCAQCQAEYDNPATRRFHAEPTCCPACGPRLSQTPAFMLARMQQGDVVAVRGIGGYHLHADARNSAAVARLRARKERSDKPFAVLAANLASVRAFAEVCPAEAALLASPARPIVLLHCRAAPQGVAPGLDTIGVMLPATPLHWLLFWEAAGRPAGHAWREQAQDALFLATSANRAGEPLAINPADAAVRLAGIADVIVDHDRDIVVRADDTVARVVAGAPVFLRRGRGVTPEPIALPAEIPSTIAYGANLKAAVCVTRGKEAFLAQHVGDLDEAETRRFHAETAKHLISILAVRPERAACDLHPDFASTRAAEASGLPLAQVQHHYAHAMACAAENGVRGAFLALALDGYGYGPGGEAWGGELLLIEGTRWRKLGGLRALPLPGGDRAAREPWRMGVAALSLLGRGDEAGARFPRQTMAPAVARLAQHPDTPRTSSCGRLFDAAAALIGVAEQHGYEAEAAMRLEALANQAMSSGLERAVIPDLWIDPATLLAPLPDLPPAEAAAQFHDRLAQALAGAAAAGAEATGRRSVVLTGGCCANARLVETLAALVRKTGLTPLLHRVSPPGDGGIALGQAWAAGLSEVSPCA